MAQRLFLLRHAAIQPDYLGRLIGATDVPLDTDGRQQLEAIGKRVRRLVPASCYSSPMKRCRQTAAAIAPDWSFALDADLREIDFGRWENRTFAEVSAEEPQLVQRWEQFAPDFAFPEGEGLSDFWQRVCRAADRLARQEAETVLAVTHGGVIRAMICYLLGLEPRQYVLFDVGYAAMAVVDLFDGRGVLAGLWGADAACGLAQLSAHPVSARALTRSVRSTVRESPRSVSSTLEDDGRG
jgi:alpha-ribazole phosphatase